MSNFRLEGRGVHFLNRGFKFVIYKHGVESKWAKHRKKNIGNKFLLDIYHVPGLQEKPGDTKGTKVQSESMISARYTLTPCAFILKGK